MTNFSNWLAAARAYAWQNWNLPADGIDDEQARRCFVQGDTPEQYIDWMAKKYDLDHVEDWNMTRACRIYRFASELTEIGEQLVIPGCEKPQSEDDPQGCLW